MRKRAQQAGALCHRAALLWVGRGAVRGEDGDNKRKRRLVPGGSRDAGRATTKKESAALFRVGRGAGRGEDDATSNGGRGGGRGGGDGGNDGGDDDNGGVGAEGGAILLKNNPGLLRRPRGRPRRGGRGRERKGEGGGE